MMNMMMLTPTLNLTQKNTMNIIISMTTITMLLMINTNNPKMFNHLMMTDFMSFPLSILTTMITLLIILSSTQYNKTITTMMMSTMILIPLFMTTDMMMFYIMFELATIPIFLMITKTGKQKERMQAAYYMMMYMIFTSLPLLLSIMLMKSPHFTSTQMMDTKINMPLMFILAFLVKTPMFLTHIWLPKAHVEAPMEGSMILAAILLKLGGLGIIRLSNSLSKYKLLLSPWIMSISLVGSMIVATMTTRQKDMKALIAYSSIAHMATTTSALFSMNTMSNKSAMMMMIAHGLTSSAMFMMITLTYQQKHSRNMMMSKGMINQSPNMNKWLFIIMISNIAAPITLSLLSEILIISTLMKSTLHTMMIIAPMSMLTTVFSMYMYSWPTHNQPSTHPNDNMNTTKHFTMMSMHIIPLIILFMHADPLL